MQSANKDLDLAEAEIEKMANTTSFPEFEVAWQAFLYRIERAWDYAESKVGKHPKGQSWISRHAHLRKKDSLLRFIKQARNAETHAVAPTLDKDIILSLKDKLGRPFSIDKIEVSFKGGELTYNIISTDKEMDLDASVVPGNPKLVRFKNRSEWYNPPTIHLEERIYDLHPVAISMLCIEYYRKCFADAENIIDGL